MSFNLCRVTVAASDAQDMLASFSNYGQCVDIIGPVCYKSWLTSESSFTPFTFYNSTGCGHYIKLDWKSC